MVKSANLKLKEGQGVSALEIFNALIMERPLDMKAWAGVGMAMAMTQQWKHALETFEFVLSQDPRNETALYGLSAVRQAMGDHQGAQQAIEAACEAAPTNWIIHRYKGHIYATTGASPAKILDIYSDWGRRFADPITNKAQPFPALSKAQKNPSRKLKVGYVSGDLRCHPIAFFIEPIFKYHDPSQIDLHVYSTLPVKDQYTQQLQSNVPHWYDVFHLSDDDLFKLIRKHQIDVLVDLSGHTVGDRLMVFARRAAPVQVTWMGYMHPLGMKAIQYRFSDPNSIPPESKKYYNETPFYIANGSTYSPPSHCKLYEQPPILKNGYPTFISLNNSRKVTDGMLQLWNQILQQIPDARLILLTDEIDPVKAEEHMRPRVMDLGLPTERITISKKVALDEFMSLAEIADIQLDTSPVSGGTTTYHALWMGLPIVCLDGNDASSKSTATILKQVGNHYWVTDNEQAYVNKAIELAKNANLLTQIRMNSREKMLHSSVMDYAQRTAEIEKSCRLLWFNYLLKKQEFTHSNYDIANVIEYHFVHS